MRQIEEETKDPPAYKSKVKKFNRHFIGAMEQLKSKICDIEDLKIRMKMLKRCRPLEPRTFDCCWKDCNPCVYHVYEDRLEEFDNAMSCLQTKMIKYENE